MTLDLPRRQRMLLYGLLFLLAIVPRLLPPNLALWDEALWLGRATNFMEALAAGNWAATAQSYHPGVMTMWLGGLGIRLAQGLGLTPSIVSWVVMVPIALTHTASVFAIFFLMRRLFGERLALVGAFLIAGDIYLIAHGRTLHIDALVTEFMAISTLLALVAMPAGVRAIRWRWLILSGVFGGMAIVTRLSALVLGGILGLWPLLFQVPIWQERPSASVFLRGTLWRGTIMPMLVWTGIAVLAIVILFPAFWAGADGLAAIRDRLDYALEVTQRGHSTFFLGVPTNDPNALYFPLIVVMRTPLWVLAGFAGGLVVLVRRRREPVSLVLAYLILYGVLYGMAMQMQNKRLPRYILPAFPFVDLVAAVGLLAAFDLLRRSGALRVRRTLARPAVALGVLLVATLLLLGSYHPYLLAYYSPLAGGGASAADLIAVGRGEGMDDAADYLYEADTCGQTVAVIGPWMEFGAYYPDCWDVTVSGPADYLVLYHSELQRDIFEFNYWEFRSRRLLHTVTLYGLEYAYIFDATYNATVSTAAATAALQPDEAGDLRLTLYGADCEVSCPFLGSWSATEISGLIPASGERFRLPGLVPGWDPYLACAAADDAGQSCDLTLNTPFASDAFTARVTLLPAGGLALAGSDSEA
jgi:4-amino-4-deoxy-L-arabinose transferase-like glycosyltransferase